MLGEDGLLLFRVRFERSRKLADTQHGQAALIVTEGGLQKATRVGSAKAAQAATRAVSGAEVGTAQDGVMHACHGGHPANRPGSRAGQSRV
jgi:hypothetical protein